MSAFNLTVDKKNPREIIRQAANIASESQVKIMSLDIENFMKRLYIIYMYCGSTEDNIVYVSHFSRKQILLHVPAAEL